LFSSHCLFSSVSSQPLPIFLVLSSVWQNEFVLYCLACLSFL
jgi:hypothetical protein